MDWVHETWRKLFVRVTAEWLALPLSARGLADELLKYCDDDGRLPLSSEEPRRALARISGAHSSELRRVFVDVSLLLRSGFIVHEGDNVRIRNFVEAQGKSKGAQRTAAWRERREASQGTSHVTSRVTSPCDAAGDASVTSLARASPLRSVPFQEEREREAQPLAAPPAPAPPPPHPRQRTLIREPDVDGQERVLDGLKVHADIFDGFDLAATARRIAIVANNALHLAGCDRFQLGSECANYARGWAADKKKSSTKQRAAAAERKLAFIITDYASGKRAAPQSADGGFAAQAVRDVEEVEAREREAAKRAPESTPARRRGDTTSAQALFAPPTPKAAP